MLRIEFHGPDEPESVVGAAIWDGRRALIEAREDDVRTALEGLFRPTPVVTDDHAYRPLGTSGEAVLQPGTMEWFRLAAVSRAPEIGLVARVVRPVVAGGWDPAAQYRRFREQVRHLASDPT